MFKPILIRCGGLTGAIFAVRNYSERGDLVVAHTGGKEDVTEQAIAAVVEHLARCQRNLCVCKRAPLRLATEAS